ncbi:ricin-type beta-trefoil lectin domain protein [Streptomyces tateyamensis]|nr:ricin-type beta-trefoil lectin domain protein [Streptomyces tateyamensis]
MPRPGFMPAARHRALRPLTVAAVLAVVLTTAAGPALADTTATADPANPTAGTPSSPVQLAQAQAKSSGKPVTVDALTTETSLTVANPDGTFTQSQNVQPVRVKKNGAWTETDSTLAKNGDGSFSPTAVPSNVALSGGGTAPLAAFTDPAGHRLAMTLPFALPAPTVSGNTATYTNVLPDVDLQATVTDQGAFHEVLVVKNAQAAANPQLKTLKLTTANSGGLTTNTDSNGNLSFKAADGTEAFHAPTPVMWDSAPAPTTAPSAPTPTPAPSTVDPAGVASSSKDGPGQGAHISALNVQADNSAITLAPDPAQLATATFPAYIDPGVAPGGQTNNYAEVKQGCASQVVFNNAQENGEGIGYQQYSSDCFGMYRSFYEMDTSRLNSGMTIVKSMLDLTETYGADHMCGHTAPVTLNFTGAINNGTNWNNQPGVLQTLGQQDVATAYGSCGYQPVNFEVTGTVSQYRGVSNLTFGITGNESTSSSNYGFMRFSVNPQLVTTYEIPPNAPDQLSLSQGNTNCAGNGWVGTTASLVALNSRLTTSMPGVNLKAGSLLVDDSTDDGHGNPFTVGWPASPNWVASGSTASIPSPVGFADGHQYEWEVWANDGYTDGPHAPKCLFNVDTTPPSLTITPSSTFPALGSGKTTTGYAGQNLTLQVRAKDPVPTSGCTRPAAPCKASGVAGIKYSLDAAIPATGAQTAATTANADGSLSATITFPIPANQWGTHTLNLSAYDNAGNSTANQVYSFYAPWNPATKITPGDLTGDGIPDLITAQGAGGNLVTIPGNTDANNLPLTASTLDKTPDAGTGWDKYLVTNRGSVTGGATDDLFVYNPAKHQLRVYKNDSATPGTNNLPGRFTISSDFTSPLTRPCVNQDLSSVSPLPACTSQSPADWSNISLTQLVAVGAHSAFAAQVPTSTYPPSDMMTVENSQLWYYVGGTDPTHYLLGAYPIGTGDWSNTTIIAPSNLGVTAANAADKTTNGYGTYTTGTPAFWARNNHTGAITAYTLTFDANGVPTSHPAAPTDATLRSAVTDANNTKYCADDGGGLADGASVRMWACNNTAAQAVTYGLDNTLHLVGKCLDVANGGTTPGTKVQLWTCNGSTGQQWVAGSNPGSLKNPASGLCLDDPQGNTDGTAQLQIYLCNGSNPQNWALNTTLPSPQPILNVGINATQFPSVVSPGDVNGDGNPDLFAISSSQQIIEYPGATPLTPAGQSAPIAQVGNLTYLGMITKQVNPTLTGGTVLHAGDSAYSANTRLIMQGDGNLVLYSLKTGQALWSTNTWGNPGAYATMQTDGNLVVYKADPAFTTPGAAANSLWSSGTPNNPGATAKVQDDCNFVVYNTAGAPVWNSVTFNPNP